MRELNPYKSPRSTESGARYREKNRRWMGAYLGCHVLVVAVCAISMSLYARIPFPPPADAKDLYTILEMFGASTLLLLPFTFVVGVGIVVFSNRRGWGFFDLLLTGFHLIALAPGYS